jgi:hypothetical protein
VCTTVTGHTSIRYSSSCHTRVNMGASIFFTAAMIRASRSARSRGNVGTNNRSLTYPQRKKSLKYVSYGFPMINFCNPGVHYETPFIYRILIKCLREKCAIAEVCQPTKLHASLFYSQGQFEVTFCPFTYLPVSCHKCKAALVWLNVSMSDDVRLLNPANY